MREERTGAAGGPARACQYIGDAKGNARDWAVCGKPSVAGRSYCQEHVEICFQSGKLGAHEVVDRSLIKGKRRLGLTTYKSSF